MGEVLPNAILQMALAAKDAGLTLDGSVASMMALQQTGGLISEKVLPFFAKRMSEAARANGGLDKAMLSNRVAMNRLGLSFQEAGDLIFKSGFAEGLTELFNETAKSVVDLKPLWVSLGRIIGSVFKILSAGLKAVTPTLKAVGVLLDDLTKLMGDSSFLVPMAAFAGYWAISLKTMSRFLPMFTGLLGRMSPVVAAALAIADSIKMAAFWGEELINLFNQDKIGVLFDPREKKKGNSGFTLGSGYMSGMDKTLSNSPLTPFYDSFKNLFLFADKLDQGLGLPTWFDATNKSPSWFGSSSSSNAVNITIGADAEKMGVTISNSGAVKDMVDSKIREVQN